MTEVDLEIEMGRSFIEANFLWENIFKGQIMLTFINFSLILEKN